MSIIRRILCTMCMLLGTVSTVSAQQELSDSLQRVLTHTTDPKQRVQLLLDLKDINEDSNLNIPFSVLLFREAAGVKDTYAMSVALIPLLNQYAAYPEKEDSIRYYVRTLRELTPGTPEEGLDTFAEMDIGFIRLTHQYGADNSLKMARETLAWCDSLPSEGRNVYQRVKHLMLRGYANTLVDYYENKVTYAMLPQAGIWEEAYDLTRQMPRIGVRKYFANLLYYVLSGAYNQAHRYADQEKLTADYIAMLDQYYAADHATGRRPYLYTDNGYVRPYQQLIRCTINIGREDYTRAHFNAFRARMLNAEGENLLRNKSYLYELGYLWKAIVGDYEEGLQYSDSLLYLINHGQGYFRMKPDKIYQTYRDRSWMLAQSGQYDASFDSYLATSRFQDSTFAAERRERIETVRRKHDMKRRKLDETHALIRNRAMMLFSFLGIGLLLIGTGIYLYRALRRNRRLQAEILHNTRKAQESERMKSVFVNTICRGIGPPMNAIDQSAQNLMMTSAGSPERAPLLDNIREQTEILLSTLDNMLEAANLDSLTDSLRLEETDIDEICRAEVLSASRLHHNDAVEYRVEAPDRPCKVCTHPKYFTFVIRALLDNAGKFTHRGCITLSYAEDTAAGVVRITVSDTGCGIPKERRDTIFRSLTDSSEASHGLSLSICRMIAGHLSGTIRLDEGHSQGASFIFTIPLHP